MFAATAFLALLASTIVQAAPTFNPTRGTPSCSLASATLPLPSGALSVASGSTIEYITLGVGIQNYSCSAAGTYASIGAVASLYDISCLYNTPLFATVQDIAYQLPTLPTTSQVSAKFPQISLPAPLVHHFFVNNPAVNGTGVNPRFNKDPATPLNPVEFVTAKKAANIASPDGAANVDWLQLSNIQGTLAQTVYRVNTKGGQPPATCTAGSPVLTVKYAAKYYFMK